jgi:hypothetical protein
VTERIEGAREIEEDWKKKEARNVVKKLRIIST